MSYLVLARKWRPQTFDDIVGQEHVGQTLMNAIRSNRVAHAFLFTGVRGVGKTTAARVLAKALNCEHGPTPDPCGECPACRAIRDGRARRYYSVHAAGVRALNEARDAHEHLWRGFMKPLKARG